MVKTKKTPRRFQESASALQLKREQQRQRQEQLNKDLEAYETWKKMQTEKTPETDAEVRRREKRYRRFAKLKGYLAETDPDTGALVLKVTDTYKPPSIPVDNQTVWAAEPPRRQPDFGQILREEAAERKKRKDEGKVTRKPSRTTTALREIKYYQKGTGLIIPKAVFRHYVRAIVEDECYRFQNPGLRVSPQDGSIKYLLRIQNTAVMALQQAAEAYLAGLFSDVNLCCIHRGKVTIGREDFRLARTLRGEFNWSMQSRDPIGKEKLTLQQMDSRQFGYFRKGIREGLVATKQD